MVVRWWFDGGSGGSSFSRTRPGGSRPLWAADRFGCLTGTPLGVPPGMPIVAAFDRQVALKADHPLFDWLINCVILNHF